MAPSYYYVSITVWKDETQRVGIALVDHIHPYLFLESLMTFIGRQSKHRKGQLEPPASDQKVSVTKNEHFFKLEVSLDPPLMIQNISKNINSPKKYSPQNVPVSTESWPRDPILGG